MGNRQRWQLGKPTTVPRELSSSILDGRKKGWGLPINTCTQRFLLGSPRTSGLGAPRAGRNLGRDGGSIGRTEILGRFLGYYWNTKFLLYIQKLILGVSFRHSWRYSHDGTLESYRWVVRGGGGLREKLLVSRRNGPPGRNGLNLV